MVDAARAGNENGLKLLPLAVPHLKNAFAWVPFGWAFLIVCAAHDLTQYWYHRMHHQVPWVWRFPRTHDSASSFAQTYLTTTLAFFGLGGAGIVVHAVKSIIVTLAHSSIPWDKPLYRHRSLHPIAWVLERLISTPATHHAQHADTSDDGVGYYKGNLGNMFFLWDVIFYFSRRNERFCGMNLR